LKQHVCVEQDAIGRAEFRIVREEHGSGRGPYVWFRCSLGRSLDVALDPLVAGLEHFRCFPLDGAHLATTGSMTRAGR
jgi:hypothetical protein